MFACKQLLMLSVCVFGYAATGAAEMTLIIATGENPPYVSERPEESFLTDIFLEVAKEMGVMFDFQFMPWKRCEASVEELKAWGAIPYISTPERQKKFYFSEELFYRQSKFFAYSPDGRHQQIPYAALSDLKGYKIGGVLGYYYEQPFLEAGLDVDFVPTEEQNFRKLNAGRVDLIPADEVLGWHLIKTLFPPKEAGNFFTLEKPLNESGIFLITSKRYPDAQNLLANFNSALRKIKENGVYQGVLKKYKLQLAY